MSPSLMLVVSALLLFAGLLCVYEYTLYTDEQKSKAPRLVPTYFRSIILLILLSLFGIAVAITSLENEPSILGVLGLFTALPALIQHRMHLKMGIDTAPLADHLAMTVTPNERDETD